MTDQGRVAMSALAGAAVGALYGYLYLTDSGRELRTQIDPKLDDFVQEMQRLRGTVDKARQAAGEGRASLAEILGDRPASASWESGGPRRATS